MSEVTFKLALAVLLRSLLWPPEPAGCFMGSQPLRASEVSGARGEPRDPKGQAFTPAAEARGRGEVYKCLPRAASVGGRALVPFIPRGARGDLQAMPAGSRDNDFTALGTSGWWGGHPGVKPGERSQSM